MFENWFCRKFVVFTQRGLIDLAMPTSISFLPARWIISVACGGFRENENQFYFTWLKLRKGCIVQKVSFKKKVFNDYRTLLMSIKYPKNHLFHFWHKVRLNTLDTRTQHGNRCRQASRIFYFLQRKEKFRSNYRIQGHSASSITKVAPRVHSWVRALKNGGNICVDGCAASQLYSWLWIRVATTINPLQKW